MEIIAACSCPVQGRPPRHRVAHSRKVPTSALSLSRKWMGMPRVEVPSPRMCNVFFPVGMPTSITSVAATKTPIIFLGVGEHLHDLDRFSPQPFISKLLGLGDMQGLMEHMQDLASQNPDKQKEMAKKLEEGKLSIRDWREQIQNVMNMFVRIRCIGWLSLIRAS